MTILIIFCCLLLLIYCALLMYYRQSWIAIPEYIEAGNNPPVTQLPTSNLQLSTIISVIIPARNEEKKLPYLLAALKAQTYPSHLFEVFIVDDHSTDGTAELVRAIPQDNIHLISLAEFIPGEKINSYKKKAIETGILHSRGTLIVTTDADCMVGENWLQTIASFYEKYKPAFIAAPVEINCSPRFIEMFQSLDFMTLQGITGASVYKKMHSMCNGANMAYEKEAFIKVDGFSNIDRIASGDDMLLMHKIAKYYPGKILFLKSRVAIVYTEPVKSITAFFNQRIRWASKANKYEDKRITLVLMIVYLLNLMLLILPVVLIVQNESRFLFFDTSLLLIWIILLGIKTIVELFFLYPVAEFFNKTKLLLLFPLAQPFHIIYTVIAGWLGIFGSYQWKGRRVK